MKFNLCQKDEGCNKIHNIRIRGTIARPDDPMGKIGVEPTLGGEKGVISTIFMWLFAQHPAKANTGNSHQSKSDPGLPGPFN